ncbi:MAG: AtpZ/AtpI family protein [Deltaproteobacteria bacterium]|nr:AtpZ/AtpI family protein [Deltaproteobacteria bacterium]
MALNDKKKPDSSLIAFGIYGAVGFQLAITVVAGLMIGAYFDKKWGSSPWLTLTGLLIGSIGGFYNLIRLLTWKNNRKK